VIIFSTYHKSYGGHEVLSIPDLTIPDGVHWIQGPNGSGKSTLLKSIAGIIPFEGSIHINNFDIKKNPVQSRRQVAYSEAEPKYPEFLSAREIIDFVAEMRGIDGEEMAKISKYFEITDFQDQATGGYSTGMLKKLSLSLAFSDSIPWILLDEPFAFIDGETEEKLIALIKCRKNEGISFIITSHHDLDHTELSFDTVCRIKGAELHKIR
jgi:ABC-2 type transport system ATP-binding protein